MKTPLRDSVNFKAAAELKKKIPPQSVVSSFLLYSGQLELSLAAANRLVIAHTNKFVIYDFWLTLKEEPERVAALAQALVKGSLFDAAFFLELQEHWYRYNDPATRSACFYVLNRCSDSALVSRGNFVRGQLNAHALARLRGLRLGNIQLYLDSAAEMTEALDVAESSDYLLIPAGRYSHNFFEEGKNRGPDETPVYHQLLKEKLKSLEKKWCLVYKFHKDLLQMYEDCDITMLNQYGRPTENVSTCEELLIANF